ncbi:hypothetical protein H9P43_004273 [Blastocladiella emersonii ATCC 22665]|nr:hypothetical protein H9P43_004273 [Blastocladiella emersonii ATCC 22665]
MVTLCIEGSSKSRHLQHKVMNLTHHELVLVADHCETGRWSLLPQPVVAPLASSSHCTCNRNGEVTGTTGSYVYRLDLLHTEEPSSGSDRSGGEYAPKVFYIAFFYSNPLVGSFKAGVRVYREVPDRAQLVADYELIHSSRTEVMFGHDNLSLFTAVSIPGARTVFEVREASTPAALAWHKEHRHASPCRWAGFAFAGAVPWPAHFVFRRLPSALPCVGPRKEHVDYHLRLASINLEDLQQGDRSNLDPMAAISQLLATFNVVCVQGIHDPRLAIALRAAESRGVTVLQFEDLAVLCEFPIVEHYAVPFRTVETTLVKHAKGLLFFRVLLPQGGAASFILTRLQSSSRPGSLNARRGSRGSALTNTAHQMEMAATRTSQTLELCHFLRTHRALLDEGVFLLGDLVVRPPETPYPPRGKVAHAATGTSVDADHLCGCQCETDCEYRVQLELLWRASGAGVAVDLFRDANMDLPVSQFLNLVLNAAEEIPEALATAGPSRNRIVYLASPAAPTTADGSPRSPAAGAPPTLRQLEIGLERQVVEMPVSAPPTPTTPSAASVPAAFLRNLAALPGGMATAAAAAVAPAMPAPSVEFDSLFIIDRTEHHRRLYVRTDSAACGS